MTSALREVMTYEPSATPKDVHMVSLYARPVAVAIAYEVDEDYAAQVELLPDPEQIDTVVRSLAIEVLRDYSCAVTGCAVSMFQSGRADLDTLRTLNGWFASMEEILDAGDALGEILSRIDEDEEYVQI